MCGNIVVSPEEAEKRLEVPKCVEDKIDRAKKFYRDLKTYKYTITAMLEGIVENALLEKDLSFSVGIEYQGELLLPDEGTGSWRQQQLEKYKEQLGKYEKRQGTYGLIKQCFLEQKGLGDKQSVRWCRCIGGLPYPQTGDIGSGQKISVYYFIALSDERLDLTFLHCAEEAYYEWCVSRLSAVFHAVSPEKVIKEMGRNAVIKQFQRNVADNFNRYMRDIFSIELEVITAISGIYYEGETCCSKLSFCLTDIKDDEVLEGVTLEPPIMVEAQKIKRIRKLLQMGKEGQCLLICRKNQAWQVRGLYTEHGLSKKSFNFQITKHMAWKMMVGEKLAVCFENGNYVIKSQEFELYKIRKKYEALFESRFGGDIEKVCREAISQTHGTTLVIIANNQGEREVSGAKQEVDRLIIESAGMKMEPMVLAEGFVKSVTSIDGALIVDPNGKCYGFGMMLDGPTENPVQGNSDYGARHNSAKRYIRRCWDNGFTAMAVVVSEDGPVTVFPADDEVKGGEEDVQK